MSESVFYTLLLVAPVLLAGAIPFFLRLSENRLKVILAFSAAYLLALSFLHLIPEIFSGPDTREAPGHSLTPQNPRGLDFRQLRT